MDNPREAAETPADSEAPAPPAARHRARTAMLVPTLVRKAPPERVPQGGAEVARAMRAKLVAEHKAVVVEAADRFAAGRASQEAAQRPRPKVLSIRLSDLPPLPPRPDPKAPRR